MEATSFRHGDQEAAQPYFREHHDNVDHVAKMGLGAADVVIGLHPGLIEGLKHRQGEHQHGEGAEVNPLLTLMGNARLANWGSLVRRRSMKDPPKTKSVMTIWEQELCQ